MRGPDDDPIEAQVSGEEPAMRGAEAEPPPRPPGGKALLRLLDLLGSAGFEQAVQATVAAAVDEEVRGDFADRVESYASIPVAVAAPRPRRRTSSSRRRTVAEERGDESVAVAEDVAQAFIDAAAQLGPPTPSGPQWRSLGPTTIPNGQTYGSSRVNVSGRVAAIAVDPSNAAHVLCGAANGGVWESFDRGASWAPRSDYAATLAVGAIAFDPSNSHTVYCGTGEGNWWWWLGAGILRSSDGGASWTTLCTAPFVGQGFFDLVVNPANGRHLLAGTTGGLYVSTDGGVTWTQRRAARCWSISMPSGAGASTGDPRCV